MKQVGLLCSVSAILCVFWGLFGQEVYADTVQVEASISMWVRPWKGMNIPKKKIKRKIRIAPNVLQIRRMWDVQYKQTRRYAVLSLGKWLLAHRPSKKTDLALLHFKNKMVVPYSIRHMRTPQSFPLFVAFAVWSPRHRIWSRAFPVVRASTKKLFRDVRPVQFWGNKIVVPHSWKPVTLSSHKNISFTPWKHIDSLVKIEWVNRVGYYRQFRFGQTSTLNKGFQLFRRVCQFCHGVRKNGAGFGWDFVEPYPIYLRRSGMSLFFHIKYRSPTAIAHGVMMPAIKGMRSRDAFAIWYWMRAAAKHPTPTYTPSK